MRCLHSIYQDLLPMDVHRQVQLQLQIEETAVQFVKYCAYTEIRQV